MFSVEFCENSKNTFYTEHLREAASVVSWYLMNFDFFFTTNSTIRYKHESVLLNSSGQVSENLYSPTAELATAKGTPTN